MAYLGELSVTTRRTTQQIAPDTVLFKVDVTGLGFTSTAPVAPAVYDERVHRIIYRWDFGDGTGTASDLWNVSGLLPQWQRRSQGNGPWAAHVYKEPDTYTVKVTAVEMVTGHTASKALTVTVGDPDTAYAGTNTICINPIGDSDFTGKPTGAAEVNTNTLNAEQTWYQNTQGGTPKRYLFKRGATWSDAVFGLDGSDVSGVTFGSYGSGAKPIINVDHSQTDPNFVSRNSFVWFNGTYGGDIQGAGGTPDLRVFGIDFRGNFDAAVDDSTVGRSAYGVRCIADAHIVMDDLSFDGVASPIGVDHQTAASFCLHVNDTQVTNFGGYTFYCEGQGFVDDDYFAMTGVSCMQKADGMDDYGQALIRSGIQILHVENCRFASTHGAQCLIECPKTPKGHGYRVNIQNNIGEGGNGFLNTAGNATSGDFAEASVHNVILEGNIYAGGWDTESMWRAYSTGTTVRNNMFIMSAMSKVGNGYSGLAYNVGWSNVWDAPDAAVIDGNQSRVYNNHCVYLRTQAQEVTGDTSFTPAIWTAGPNADDLPDMLPSNNVIHAPNLTNNNVANPITTYAPLKTDVIINGHIAGLRPNGGALDTAYAMPDMQSWEPEAGSAALGAASGSDIAVMDIRGLRHGASVNEGCWR